MKTRATAFLPYAFRSRTGSVVHRVRRVEIEWDEYGRVSDYRVDLKCSDWIWKRSEPILFRDLPDDLPRCRTCFK